MIQTRFILVRGGRARARRPELVLSNGGLQEKQCAHGKLTNAKSISDLCINGMFIRLRRESARESSYRPPEELPCHGMYMFALSEDSNICSLMGSAAGQPLMGSISGVFKPVRFNARKSQNNLRLPAQGVVGLPRRHVQDESRVGEYLLQES